MEKICKGVVQHHSVGANQATEDMELWKHVIADVVLGDMAL